MCEGTIELEEVDKELLQAEALNLLIKASLKELDPEA